MHNALQGGEIDLSGIKTGRGSSDSRRRGNGAARKLATITSALSDRKRFSIAAHYRNVSEAEVSKVERAVNEVTARHPELRKIENKKVFELQPNVDWDKGKAVIWILDLLGWNRKEALSALHRRRSH